MDNFFTEQIKALQKSRQLNDSQTAKLLGVNRQFFHKFTHGKKPIPIRIKFRILDFSGYAWTRDNILKLLPDEVAQAIVARDDPAQ